MIRNKNIAKLNKKSNSVTKSLKATLNSIEPKTDNMLNRFDFRKKISRSKLLDDLLTPLQIQENDQHTEESEDSIKNDSMKITHLNKIGNPSTDQFD